MLLFYVKSWNISLSNIYKIINMNFKNTLIDLKKDNYVQNYVQN